MHAIVGLPGHSIYAGTKGAINAFSRELAVELTAKHIRVNVLAPGSIEVPSYFSGGSGYTRETRRLVGALGARRFAGRCGLRRGLHAVRCRGSPTGQAILDGGLTAKMALPYQPVAGERTDWVWGCLIGPKTLTTGHLLADSPMARCHS